MTPSWHAEGTPDVLAIVRGGTGETVTYAELDDRSRRLARALRERSVAVGDHPGPCPNLVPWFLCGLTATAGGSWCLGACVGFRRRRPDARRRLVMALSTWAGALLALGVWAAVVDDSSRLSGPGGALVVLAAVNAGMCALVAGLVTWFPGGNGCAVEA